MIIKKLIKLYLSKINFFTVYFCVSIFFILSKKNIKFLDYLQSEIGSATWVDGFLRRIQNHNDKEYKYICIVSGNYTANQFFEKLRENQFKKYRVITIKNKILTKFLGGIFLYENNFTTNEMTMLNYYEFSNLKKIDWLEDNQDLFEEEIKKKLGMKKNDWFVCFFSRDDSYDKINRPKMTTSFQIRNTDIKTFLPAMDYITSEGGYAIRIGSTASEKLINSNKKIIDYSFSTYQNQMNDFLLLYFCNYCVGTPSGILDLATLNDKPLVLVNNYEYMYMQNFNKGLFIPKLLLKKDGEFLTLKDYMKKIGKTYSIDKLNNLINKYNLTYIDNSSDDILQITQEMFKILKDFNFQNKNLNFAHYDSKNGLEIFKSFSQKYKI